MLWIEFAILVACIVVGARVGGVGLGAVSGIGLLIFVFILGMPPGNPPTTVLGMIIAVITALAAMQAAGGLDFLIGVAGKLLAGASFNEAEASLFAGIRVWREADGSSKAIGFRNALIHGYAQVDGAIVWRAATEDLPRLRSAVDTLLSELWDPP